MDYRRRKNEEDFEKKEEENRSSEVRKLRQLKFAPYVRKALRKNDVHMGKSRQVVEERLRDFRKNERKKKKDY